MLDEKDSKTCGQIRRLSSEKFELEKQIDEALNELGQYLVS
jgi:hypothetical protein